MAQAPVPPGVVKGVLQSRDAAAAGEFSIQTNPAGMVYRFRFDQKTWVERNREAITVGLLSRGEPIEVVSDNICGCEPLSYARTVHVLELRRSEPPPVKPGMLRIYRTPVDMFAARPDLTYSGVVAQLSAERMILRTRHDGDKVINLRPDTRYLEGGALVPSANLTPNTLVFVTGGRDRHDEIEAWQVVWGGILQPDRE